MPLAVPASEQSQDLNSKAARVGMAKLITNLFALWKLKNADQLQLLGMSINSRSLLPGYRQGRPLPDSRDVLDRVGHLLSIHKALGLLYPHNEELRYSWVKRRNKAFSNMTPLEVMRDQGIVGLARVARHLDFVRGI